MAFPIFKKMIGTFFSITSGNIASTTAYAGNLVGDFMPLLVVILGIIIGAFIIRVIANII
jgi:hypothetical protein